jgi:hypothetical protein
MIILLFIVPKQFIYKSVFVREVNSKIKLSVTIFHSRVSNI